MSTDRDIDEDAPDEVEAEKPKRSFARPAWLLPAVLVAAFGLAAVLVGGGAAYLALSGQASGQQKVADAHDRTVATGAARLMEVEFRHRAEIVAAALKAKHYPAGRVVLATKLSVDDQRGIAAAMDAKHWGAVADGLTQLGHAQRLLVGHRRAPLSKRDRAAMRKMKASFKAADAALSAFATRSA
jgi:hypothetical protein